jgi:amino-acid N-acetyltransferase
MEYRKANFDDIEQIFSLVNQYAAEGIMLARSRNTLYETLRDMVVAVEEGKVIGVGGLHVMWDRVAEVRTMAVLPSYTRHGIGARIVECLLKEGAALGVKKFITLTYKPGFFQTLGFQTITKDQLPHKIWKDCIDCPKFPNCDEIAMVKDL